MDARPALSLEGQLAATLDWWREAGVDFAFHDDPQGWLKREEDEAALVPAAPAVEKPAAPPAPRLGGDPAQWPTDLEAFRHWWLGEPSLDPAPLSGRVASRGPAQAPLLVLVPMPEADDHETLLSGAQGRLVGNMLRAMGVAQDEASIAAVLPRHMPHADWGTLVGQGLGEVLRHHLALAAPRRVLALGRDILPLLAHDPTQHAPTLEEIAIQGRAIPLIASYAPELLLAHRRCRAELWRQWLDRTGRN